MSCLDLVLEGGFIKNDGLGTLLTTSECLLSPNRNDQLSKVEIKEYLRSTFHLEWVSRLDYGYLAGDGMDSHINTLACFCSPNTITYMQRRDVSDGYYEELHRMEGRLKTFQTFAGEPYKLLALPVADKIEVEGERFPATHANFLVMNSAVLYPTYSQSENDIRAQEMLQKAFSGYETVGVDCRILIEQHSSLHCITIQYPVGVIKWQEDMGVVNLIFYGIFITMYTTGWLFPKFRQYTKKNTWLDNLPGVLELIFLLNFSEYFFVEQWNWEYDEILP